MISIFTENAQHVSRSYSGPPDKPIEVDVWRYNIVSTNVTVIRAVTVPDCWPVYQMEYGVFEEGNYMYFLSFQRGSGFILETNSKSRYDFNISFFNNYLGEFINLICRVKDSLEL